MRNYLAQLQQGGGVVAASVSAKPAARVVDYEKFGKTDRKPLTSLRKKIGEQMSSSWGTVPHVTQFDEASQI